MASNILCDPDNPLLKKVDRDLVRKVDEAFDNELMCSQVTFVRGAEKLGFEKEKFVRLRSGLLYTLNKLSEVGHCYALRDQLVKTGSELLSVEEAVLSLTLDEMIRAEDVKVEPAGEGIAIYLPPFYFSEVGTERRIKEIFGET